MRKRNALNFLRAIHQLPSVLLWSIPLMVARRKNCSGIIVSDIGSNASVTSDTFIASAEQAIEQLKLISPETHYQVTTYVKHLANAGVKNEFEYYRVGKLLLLGEGYALGPQRRVQQIVDCLVEVSTMQAGQRHSAMESDDMKDR